MISYRLPDSSCDKHFSTRKVFLYIRHFQPSQRMVCSRVILLSAHVYLLQHIYYSYPKAYLHSESRPAQTVSDSSNVIITGPRPRERPEWRNAARVCGVFDQEPDANALNTCCHGQRSSWDPSTPVWSYTSITSIEYISPNMPDLEAKNMLADYSHQSDLIIRIILMYSSVMKR